MRFGICGRVAAALALLRDEYGEHLLRDTTGTAS